MKLLVGLGNPGEKYNNTRHNVGFIVIDKILKTLNVSSNDYKEKFKGHIYEKNNNGEKILILKPQTFMNLSGDSLIEVVNFYKIDPKLDIIVIHDDMDLPFGKIRIREKGSAAGHNGLKSIISHIGEDFFRIKCGIGKSDKDTVSFVLGEFQNIDKEILDQMTTAAANAAIDFINDFSIDKLMQKYNKK